MELFHVQIPVVYGSSGYHSTILRFSKPLDECSKGGRPVGTPKRELLERTQIAICCGCKGASLHQVGFFCDLFKHNVLSDQNSTNNVSCCLVEAALAVTFEKCLLMSNSVDLWWGADGSSHRTSRSFIALTVGGTTLNSNKKAQHWRWLLNFSELIAVGGAKTLFDVFLASLHFTNHCQRLLGVSETKLTDFFACLTDGASENSGQLGGLYRLFVERAKQEWNASDASGTFVEPVHKKCDTHLVALFAKEADRRLLLRTRMHYGNQYSSMLKKDRHITTYLAFKVSSFLTTTDVRCPFRHLTTCLGVKPFPLERVDESRFFSADLACGRLYEYFYIILVFYIFQYPILTEK